MRVLHLIDSLDNGGAERSLEVAAPHLLRRGVGLEVAFLRSPDRLASSLERSGVEVHDLRGDDRRVRQIDRIASLLRQRRPDLLHTTLWRSDVAGRPAAHVVGVPAVTTWAATIPVHGSAVLRLKRARATELDRRTARLARRFHAVSQPVATEVGERLGIDPSRIDVISRARDVDALGERNDRRRDEARRRFGIGDAPLIVALARQEPSKRLDVLVDAMATISARHPDARLLIAGREGNDSELIRSRIARLDRPDAVRLLGSIDDVGDLLAAADVCAVPSSVEGFPGTVVESMIVGTPIVASDIATVRSAVPSTDALLVPVGSAGALAAAVLAVIADPVSAAQRARRARAHALTHYAIDAVADSTVSFYERALDTSGVPA